MTDVRVLSDRFLTARKQYTCWKCSYHIKQGDKYLRSFVLMYEDPVCFKTCKKCDELATGRVR